MAPKKAILDGVLVTDFSWVFTGSLATQTLGYFGATVIKIESPSRPDDVRGYAPFRDTVPGIDRSAMFAFFNTNKLSVSLDLHHPKSREVVRRLVARTDVVVDTFSPGTLKQWSLDYEGLRKIKPDIILISATMQGQTGPFALQHTFGAFLQSTLGFTGLLGWPDRPPSPPPSPYPDFITPWFVLIAVLSAIDYRRRTGEGNYIDVSQAEASLHFLGPALLDSYINKVSTRAGNRSSVACPHGVYLCKGDDRWCAIAVTNETEWEALCRTTGHEEWLAGDNYATFARRKENEDELERLISQWTARHAPEEAMRKLQAAGVPAGVVQTGEDLLDFDPQLKYREHFKVTKHPEIGHYVAQRPSFKLSRLPAQTVSGSPLLGEHNEYVCRDILNFSEEEFVSLMADGVLG